MSLLRPDLSNVDPAVRDYIQALEAELDQLRSGRKREKQEEEPAPVIPLEPSEPPTTLNVVTLTASGIGKRTPRHLYTRQRRGGMGIFDLDTDENDPPAILAIADESQSLLLFSNLARAFRVPMHTIPETPIRSRGQSIMGRIPFLPEERLVAALPDIAKGSVAMVSERGMVRLLRHHVFGEYMKPGTVLFDIKQFGRLVGACRTPGDADLFIATRQGHAIRFSEKLVPPQGGPGIRVEGNDQAVAVAAVEQEDGVFLVSADGKGTIRAMPGFNPNKSAGGSGKIAMGTHELSGAITVDDRDDIFMISQLSKIIRFMAAEVPVKEGVVQGVNCMALRADQVTAVTRGSPAL